MRSVLTALLIVLAIVIGGLSYTEQLEKLSGQLVVYSGELAKDIEAENFDGALEQLKIIEDFLEERRTMMESTGKHGNMYEIKRNIIELRSYIECKAKKEALTKNKSLEFLFEDLPKNFHIRIENIL